MLSSMYVSVNCYGIRYTITVYGKATATATALSTMHGHYLVLCKNVNYLVYMYIYLKIAYVRCETYAIVCDSNDSMRVLFVTRDYCVLSRERAMNV